MLWAVLSQQIVLFSTTKQTAPVLLSVSYFSMPVSSFTLTLSPACVWNRAEPNFPFLALSRISDRDQCVSDKPSRSCIGLECVETYENSFDALIEGKRLESSKALKILWKSG